MADAHTLSFMYYVQGGALTGVVMSIMSPARRLLTHAAAPAFTSPATTTQAA